MADERNTQKRGIINSILGVIFNTLFILFVSLFLSVIVELCGLYFEWWEGGTLHSLGMLRAEMGYANSDIESAIITNESDGWLAWVIQKYKVIILGFFYWTSQTLAYISTNNMALAMYIDSGYNIAMVFILRLILIIYSFPLFLMVFIWGLVDGLVERDLRKFGAGRESSTIFEAARSLSFPLLVLPFIIYLSFPTTINPLYVFPTSAIFQGLLYRLLFSKYKKYL